MTNNQPDAIRKNPLLNILSFIGFTYLPLSNRKKEFLRKAFINHAFVKFAAEKILEKIEVEGLQDLLDDSEGLETFVRKNIREVSKGFVPQKGERKPRGNQVIILIGDVKRHLLKEEAERKLGFC